MKGIGMILILVSCCGLGFQMALQYERRIGQCVEIQRAMQRLLGEIRFRQVPLAEALCSQISWQDRYGADMSQNRAESLRRRKSPHGVDTLLQRLVSRMKEGQGGCFAKLWQEELDQWLSGSLLGEEAELLCYLGSQLGQLDLAEQERTLKQFLEQWEEQICYLRKEGQQKMRLYRYLGIFAGVFLVIVFL